MDWKLGIGAFFLIFVASLQVHCDQCCSDVVPLTLLECSMLETKPQHDELCSALIDCTAAGFSSCSDRSTSVHQNWLRSLTRSLYLHEKKQYCVITYELQTCMLSFASGRSDQNCIKAMEGYTYPVYELFSIRGYYDDNHKLLNPGHKCVNGLAHECEGDGVVMPSDRDAGKCCYDVINKYKPYNQFRCGKIPNDYYCADDAQCDSGNCPAIASNADRGSLIRTCAPKGKQGWQAACTTDSECASEYLNCAHGRCDCVVVGHGGVSTDTCCNDKCKVGTEESGCIMPAVGDPCTSDVQCADKTGISRSCDGSKCVAVDS